MLHCHFLRIRTLFPTSVRWKTAKFKPKIARSRPLKTPSVLALDHFDFYYGPMFDKKWPSIRLGLLSPNKYVAVVNTLSKSHETHEEILADLGTVDLLKRIRGKTASERVEEKKRKVETKANEETQRVLQEMEEEDSSPSSIPTLSHPISDSSSLLRSSAGLGEFRPPEGELTRGDLQLGKKKETEAQDFDVTGYEGDGVRLSTRDHFILYPKNLHIRTYDRGSMTDYPPPVKDDNKIPSWWLLDGGSLVPILALNLEEGDRLLDVCAAPGGKSLLALLTGLPAKIVCNDFKLSRLGQLKRALATYVPAESAEADKIILKRKDAGNVVTWDELNAYDKVLADVPCSTDRLAVSQDEGNLFSPPNTQLRLNLPQLQTKILINALRACRPGGSVVYSTCTLSPIQNEAVVENAVALAEHKFGIKVVEESLSQLVTHLSSSGLFRFSEQCQRGALVLPFLPSNFGPMYVCKLHRLK